MSSTAGTHRSFVSYIDKSREYYAAQGYELPYRWAVHDSAPFSPLRGSPAEAIVGVVTTAARTLDDTRAPFAQVAEPPPSTMETAHLSWHQTATHTDDLGTFLPLEHLDELARLGEIGNRSDRFYGLPTNYSHRRTRQWSSQIVDWALEDRVDVMLLIPL